jgi:hypothetical protein
MKGGWARELTPVAKLFGSSTRIGRRGRALKPTQGANSHAG